MWGWGCWGVYYHQKFHGQHRFSIKRSKGFCQNHTTLQWWCHQYRLDLSKFNCSHWVWVISNSGEFNFCCPAPLFLSHSYIILQWWFYLYRSDWPKCPLMYKFDNLSPCWREIIAISLNHLSYFCNVIKSV